MDITQIRENLVTVAFASQKEKIMKILKKKEQQIFLFAQYFKKKSCSIFN